MISPDKKSSVFLDGDLSHAEARRGRERREGGSPFPAAAIDRSTWKRVRLGEVLNSIAWANAPHTKPAAVPVISQGDDEQSLIGCQYYYQPKQETILFGDHTCKVKLIDSPCHLSGDGIKLLVPANSNNSTLFLHQLACFMAQKIPQGYARHLSAFKGLHCYLPTRQKQNQIASSLCSCDVLIDSLQSLISKYEAIKKATVKLLLMPKDDWHQIRLGDIGEISMCKRILKSQTSATGDVPFYKIGTFGKQPDAFISRALFEDFKRRFSYPKVGDVLLSAAGTIGRTVVFNGEEAYFQDSNIVWISNDESIISNPFLNVIYSQINWQTENGGTVSRLYNANIQNTIVSIPDIEEQKRIVTILDSIDDTISELRAQLAKSQSIKQGMMTYFFG